MPRKKKKHLDSGDNPVEKQLYESLYWVVKCVECPEPTQRSALVHSSYLAPTGTCYATAPTTGPR